MNKEELIKYICNNSNVSRVDAETSINGFVFAIKDAMANGEDVDIDDLGKFKAIEWAKNSPTLPQGVKKKIISFSASSKLLDDVA